MIEFSRLRCWTIAGVLFAALPFVSGCRTTTGGIANRVARPTRYAIPSEQFTVSTDFKLPEDHPLIGELQLVRKQVAATLGLPTSGDDVMVYIFETEMEYRQFLAAAFPGLPPRRAYFIGTTRELAVYTYWGDRIREDLRHEFTHGLLHAALDDVPLWLDEGLAEYFEVPGETPGGLNSDYAERLAQAVDNGWQPDMQRLEQLEEVGHMQGIDYQEAWAWVHYLMHSTPDNRELLLSYLREHRNDSGGEPLSSRIAQALPDADAQLLGHLAILDLRGQTRIGAR